MGLISVIVPVYNAENTLSDCLGSILAQTYGRLEVICVDDGSTDDSRNILSLYEASDPRVRVITRPNGGAGAARNTGLRGARGEWLSFLDADDSFEPDMYEVMLLRLHETGADICVCASDSANAKTGGRAYNFSAMREEFLPGKEPFVYSDIPDYIFDVFRGWPWDKLFKADLIKREGLMFQEIENSNDLFFVDMALALSGGICCEKRILAHKLEEGKSSISMSGGKDWMCCFDALMRLRGELSSRSLYKDLERGFCNRAVTNVIWNLRVLDSAGRRDFGNFLREEGFAKLGLTGRHREYYYQKEAFRAMCKVMNGGDPGPLPGARKRSAAYALKKMFPALYNRYRSAKYGEERGEK